MLGLVLHRPAPHLDEPLSRLFVDSAAAKPLQGAQPPPRAASCRSHPATVDVALHAPRRGSSVFGRRIAWIAPAMACGH